MMDNTQIVGDYILISNYVRYERLSELINAEFVNSDAEEICLFIDAYSMIKSIYGYNPSQFIDKFSISSCIINACAHYRNFFWTRYRVTCKIWIVFSRMDESLLEGKQYYPQYSNIFVSENNFEMDKLLEENMEVLKTLCPYIPDVQFVYSGYEPGLVFGRIGSNYPNIPKIIVSKDIWNLQVVANVPNTYMLRPHKVNGEDVSMIINRKQVISYYLALRKNKFDAPNIDASFISFLLASTRFPERGLKSLHNVSFMAKHLMNAIEKKAIANKRIYDIPGLCKDLDLTCGINLKSFEIGLRMNAIDYFACMYRYTMNPMIKSENIEIFNLHDPDSVKQINETYFKKVPLDLMSL